MRNERYYYSIMSPAEKRAYKTIFEGLRAKALNIAVDLELSPDEIQEVYLKVLYDNPSFYYINQTVIDVMNYADRLLLLPKYLYGVKEIEQINRELRDVIERIKAHAEGFQDNAFRLEKYLHDSVVKSVAYDYNALKKRDCYDAHSIVGALLEKRAVCEGIAKAFKLLCNQFDIKCIVVLGQADKNRVYDGESYHAWNLVKIEDESYYVDVTWDNMYDEDFRHISYDYFNITTEELLLDHLPIGELPLCDSKRLNYFEATGSYVHTYEELVTLVRRRIGNKEITFKAVGDRGYFQSAEQLKNDTLSAVTGVLREMRRAASFALLFNEAHHIGKILFEPEANALQPEDVKRVKADTVKKIDLRKYF